MRIIALLWIVFGISLARADMSPKMLNYVENAPIVTSSDSLDQLVSYLVRPYHTDEDKAKSILTWIVYYVDYDDYTYRQIDRQNNSKIHGLSDIPNQEDIIKTRLGVCKDIAQLYTTMLAKADIKSRVVSGCVGTKNVDMRKCSDPHAWTVVWIDKQWEFVDPTYAMGGRNSAMEDVKTKLKYKQQVSKRSRRLSDAYKKRDNRHVDLSWFMTQPRVMNLDHHPYEKRWRLLGQDRRKMD